MKHTVNYGLNKPDSTDFVNIEHHNENMDKVDEALAKKLEYYDHDVEQTDICSLTLKPGWHRCQHWVNQPSETDGQGDCFVIVYKRRPNESWQSRIFKDPHSNKVWVRQHKKDKWQNWEQIATAVDLGKKISLSGSMDMTGNFCTDMGENFGGFQVIRKINDMTGKVILGNTVINGKPGGGLALWHNSTEVAAFRFNDEGASMYYRPTGKIVNIATATPPQWYTLPLVAGLTPNSPAQYCKTQEGIVYLRGWIKGALVGTPGNSITIANLPIGFRPTTTVHCIVPHSTYSPDFRAARIDILPNGCLELVAADDEGTLKNGLALNISFATH